MKRRPAETKDKQINPPLSLSGKENTRRGKLSPQATEILETEWPSVETERQQRQARRFKPGQHLATDEEHEQNGLRPRAVKTSWKRIQNVTTPRTTEY
jgi:hypothetical protein